MSSENMAELPAIGSVWGVPGDTSTWMRVASNDEPPFRGREYPLWLEFFNGGDDEGWTLARFWDVVNETNYVRIDNDDAGKLAYLKTKGLTVGWAKDAGKDPYLQYVIEPGSELCDLETVNKLVDAESTLKRYETELAKCAEILQRVHPEFSGFIYRWET